MGENIIKTVVKVNDIYFYYNEFKKTSDDSDYKRDDLDKFRKQLRLKIKNLQNHLYKCYTPKMIEYLIVPTIAYLDENIRITLQKHELRWDGFQNEFLGRDDLGEYFFKLADDIIRDNIYLEEVYICFWLVLRLGFCGKYYDSDKSKLSLYHKHIKRELQFIIPKDRHLVDPSNELKDKTLKNFLLKVISWFRKQKIQYIGLLVLITPVVLYIFTFVG